MARVTTISEYRRKVQEVITGQGKVKKDGNVRFEWRTVEEARLVIKEIRLVQKQLRLIKKEVNQDIRTIRQVYKQHIANVGSGSGLAGFLIGKGRARSIKASEKRGLREEHDRKIEPYQQVKLIIDQTLTDFDGAKLKVEKFIAENQQ